MKKILLLCTGILFSVSIIAQNSANLKMNLEKNKVYRLKLSSDQTINQTINGNQQTIESKTDYVVSLKMIDATADFMIAEVHFDTLKTVTNAMGKVVNMSSANEGDIKSTESGDVMSCIMNRISKNPIYAKIDFTGKPIEIVNSKMLSEIILKDTGSIVGQTAAVLKNQIKGMVNENNFKTMIEPFTWYLPGRQVNTGESWEFSTTSTSGGMSLDITTNFHLDKITGNSAQISTEANIKASLNAAPMKSGGATITYDDIKGLSKSNLSLDTRTGLVIEDNVNSHISGNLGVSMPGMSMQIPMDINGVTKIVALP
jgi:hypothetical protein